MPHQPARRRTLLALASLPLTTALRAENSPAVAPSEEVPYVQTPARVVQRMLQMAELRPGELLWDLGSGDGRIVIAAARDFGARGVGYEIDPTLIAESRRLAAAAGVSERTRFEQRDLFTLAFSEPAVVSLYLLPDFNLKLRPLLLAQMRPGSRVVSHEWDMGDWRPDEQFSLYSPEKPHGLDKTHKAMLWVIPARVAGRWRVELSPASQTLELTLTQRYQEVQAQGGAQTRIFWSQLRGTALAVSLQQGRERYVLRGEVGGDSWHGTVHSAGQTATMLGQFRASRLS